MGLKPRLVFGFYCPSAKADGKAKQSKVKQSKARAAFLPIYAAKPGQGKNIQFKK